MAERIWIIIAAFSGVAAGLLLWRNYLPAAFVTATLGAVAWFLSYRVEMRARIAAAEQEPNEAEAHEETDEK